MQKAFHLLENPHWDAIGPSGKLRKENIIKLFDGEPFLNRAFTVDETILQFLTGFTAMPSELQLISKLHLKKQDLVDSHLAVSNYIETYIYENSAINIVGLYGDTKDKLDIASHIAERIGSDLYIINAFSLPDSLSQISKFSLDWNSASKLNKTVLYLDCSGIDLQNTNNLKSVHQFLLNIESLVFIDSKSDLNINLENVIGVQVKNQHITNKWKYGSSIWIQKNVSTIYFKSGTI
ncbi:MAG: hypothetical protein IPJ43_02535 [Saprospiraceae bacterium]|nr:hypothetical protein [Saprospiraceae bacterium]